MPNPIFVLARDSLEILDCNDSVTHVYGYFKSEVRQRSFLDFFRPEDRELIRQQIRDTSVINQVRQLDKEGNFRYFNIRISPSDFPGTKALLVTTSDITQWLETEQQLIQASKMATLGEMATGVAHELNQPLAVIKTASNFFMKKIRKGEPISSDILQTMAEEIDGHVDRATKIINHMRQFGRKSTGDMAPVDLNRILASAFEIFSQQLKLRGISVEWQLEDHLSPILGDAGRLEQVFINLLLNARDAISDRDEAEVNETEKCITLRTRTMDALVVVEVQDTGMGIDPSIAERIFEPFYTTKKVGKGDRAGIVY